jgi:hypothetical protein
MVEGVAMGLYDCRCMVTAVSLKGADAALVLLQQAGDSYHPVALPIKGTYNRLGSIDFIREDANTRLVLTYFRARLKDGGFVVDAGYFRDRGCYPIKTIERLLTCFERNMNDYFNAAVLGGQRVVFALICRAVWDAVARASPPAREPASARFQRLFGGVAVAEEIYRGSLAEVSKPLKELSAVSEFLTDQGLGWRPADHPGQHYPEDMRQYLVEARRTFSGSAAVLDGLKAYERKVSWLLEDD